jgi:glycosyltransferase involved in cell wall biosynthesis
VSSVRAAFVIPGDLGLPTGGYAYDRHVLARAAAHGVDLTHLALPGSFPAPTDADLVTTATRLSSLPADTVVLVDGLAFGAMPEALVQSIRQRIVALVHHPLCLETGLSEARAATLRASEIAALRHARAVIATSVETGKLLTRAFGVPDARLAIAEPGVARAQRARGTGHPLTLLAVGSIVPRKAYGVLLEALAGMDQRPEWRLAIVGAARDPNELARVVAALSDARLRDRVRLLTDADDAALDALYASADVFVLPSHYEGYGMVLTEAMVRGLPIVTTSGVAAAGPFADVVRIVAPGDAPALQDALRAVLTDDAARRRMADASWAAAQRLPSWDDTARTIADVLKRVAA